MIAHRQENVALFDGPANEPGYEGAAGGPVGIMHAELAARLSHAEYESWLLPPEPRYVREKLVQISSEAVGWLILALGVIGMVYVIS